jgi:ribosomal RNA-processing protein 36
VCWVQVEREWKDREKSKLEAGKKPYYLKDSEKRKLVLEKKFEKLQETGQLEKYMAKKRKRQASKLHTKLPERRDRSMPT